MEYFGWCLALLFTIFHFDIGSANSFLTCEPAYAPEVKESDKARRLGMRCFTVDSQQANICGAIDCFKCVSINGDNPACDDPFHNNYTAEIYESPCMGGRKDRNGLFPATACIKMAGQYQNGTKITVRGCALDSGSLTIDTEIIRMSHCGAFYFDGNYVRGCLLSCHDADACNSGTFNSITTALALLQAFCVINSIRQLTTR